MYDDYWYNVEKSFEGRGIFGGYSRIFENKSQILL